MGHYEALGIERNASVDDIKKAYRKLAMRYHPDRQGGDPEKFKEINQAHETLTDPERRARYDQFGTDEPNMPQQGPDISHIFQSMFGNMNMGGGGPPGRRGDHQHVIELSLDEVYNGTTKTIKVTVNKPCFTCQKACPTCRGQGMIQEVQNMGFLAQMFQRACPQCQGAGRMSHGCPQCQHQKTIKNVVSMNFHIESGIVDGTTKVVEGLGEQPRTPSEQPGNLVIVLRIKKHPKFERNGNDLRYTLTITIEEAISGYEFDIPHFGGTLKMKTHDFAPIVDPRKDYKVQGKGLTKDSDLYINFDIQYPRDMSLRYQLTPVDYVVEARNP